MFDYRQVMDRIVEEAIENGRIAGANVLLLHGGKEIYGCCKGYADKENKVPMTENTIFRMFSMSKPVTAAAAMILAEQGRIDLWDKVGKYIPEFAHMQVYTPEGKLRPACQEITVWNLLNMTSGLSYPNEELQAGRDMARLFRELDREAEGGRQADTMEFCRRAAGVPLAFEPGEKWMYGLSADILGGVIEAASGRKFGEFLREEIFEPLGMKDTGFIVPESKRSRFAVNYKWNEEKGELEPFLDRHLALEDYNGKVRFESGGAGLVSTIEDYSKFARMLLGGGTCHGVRILGRKTVDMMARDHLSPQQKADYNWDSVRGYGYGCLMRVLTDQGKAGSNASLGEFGWDGWTGCYVTIDRSENLALLYFIQRCDSGTTEEVRKLRMAAYAAVE